MTRCPLRGILSPGLGHRPLKTRGSKLLPHFIETVEVVRLSFRAARAHRLPLPLDSLPVPCFPSPMGDSAEYRWEDYNDTEAPPCHKITDRDIFDQMIASRGNISHAARALGVARRRVKERVDTVPALQALKVDMVDEVLDTAEDNVFAGVERKDAADTRFVLQTLGRERGWMQGVAGSGKNGEIVVNINHLSGDGNGSS